jgi:soluble lytic murein transglycosylase-like protein
MVARVVLACAAVILWAVPASAELVYFSTGRTMSVKSHRVEGASIVLVLRSGGEMTCDASAIARIAPDEVPYPEPAPQAATAGPGAGGQTIDPAMTFLAESTFDPIIDAKAAEHGVNPALVRAVIHVESGYRPRARSAKGAMGLMQLMPATARQYAVKDPYDPAANIDAGVRHLRSLLDRLPLNLALAAYNAGEATIQRFGGIPPYAETRSYVARILALVGR